MTREGSRTSGWTFSLLLFAGGESDFVSPRRGERGVACVQTPRVEIGRRLWVCWARGPTRLCEWTRDRDRVGNYRAGGCAERDADAKTTSSATSETTPKNPCTYQSPSFRVSIDDREP